MGLKGGDCARKAKVKIKQCENLLGAVYANRETCQISTYLSHEFIESKVWGRVLGYVYTIQDSFSCRHEN